MVQIGLNMGARVPPRKTLRVLGWSKSFTLNLSEAARIQADTNLMGVMSLFWVLMNVRLPRDLLEELHSLIAQGYPTLGTNDVPAGMF